MSLGLPESVKAVWSPYTALLLGVLGAALLPFAAWAFTRRRCPAPPPGAPQPVPHLASSEHRGAVRRAGNPVPVVVLDGAARQYRGFVIDRSAGGLCLTLPRHLAAGSALAVRAAAAPEDSPWVEAVVVHSTELGAGVWRVGCQFTSPPPGAVVRFFG